MKIFYKWITRNYVPTCVFCVKCNQIIFRHDIKIQTPGSLSNETDIRNHILKLLNKENIYFCFSCGHKIEPPTSAKYIQNFSRIVYKKYR